MKELIFLLVFLALSSLATSPVTFREELQSISDEKMKKIREHSFFLDLPEEKLKHYQTRKDRYYRKLGIALGKLAYKTDPKKSLQQILMKMGQDILKKTVLPETPLHSCFSCLEQLSFLETSTQESLSRGLAALIPHFFVHQLIEEDLLNRILDFFITLEDREALKTYRKSFDYELRILDEIYKQ